MEKMNFNDFKEYLKNNNNKPNVIYHSDKDTVSLLVYCFEGEYEFLTISVEAAYNDFYEYVINEPEEVIINGHQMMQMRELTIDWVVAQGYESYVY